MQSSAHFEDMFGSVSLTPGVSMSIRFQILIFFASMTQALIDVRSLLIHRLVYVVPCSFSDSGSSVAHDNANALRRGLPSSSL